MAWRRGQTYSHDLRERVLAADEDTAREAAERFGVSVSYVVKARQRRDRDGVLTAARGRSGSRPVLAEYYAAIDAHVREHSGATLQERRTWLRETHGVSVSLGTMWNTLRRLELTHKKRASRRASAPARTSRKPDAFGTGCAGRSMSNG